ncbi:MAG: hypothetical protein FWH04_05145 [Oscillospiraceae bacterium]|nr:hypothetical protein [Oscillospiraceae bacterium]
MKLKHLTFSAMMAASSAVLMFLSTAIPFFELTLSAAAGLCPLAAMLYGKSRRAGLLTWACASVLGLVLFAGRQAPVLYLCIFGLYPTLKSLCETQRHRKLSFLLKLLSANAGFWASVLLFYLIFPAILESYNGVLLPMAVTFNVFFLLYDFFLTRVAMRLAVMISRMKQ